MQGRTNNTQVYVVTAQKGLLKHRMQVITRLWDADINAEMSFKANAKYLDQMQYCENRLIPWAVIIGESEIEKGIVNLHNVKTREVEVRNDNLLQAVLFLFSGGSYR